MQGESAWREKSRNIFTLPPFCTPGPEQWIHQATQYDTSVSGQHPGCFVVSRAFKARAGQTNYSLSCMHCLLDSSLIPATSCRWKMADGGTLSSSCPLARSQLHCCTRHLPPKYLIRRADIDVDVWLCGMGDSVQS